MDPQKTDENGVNGAKMLKNIFVVPRGSLGPSKCLSQHRAHLFSTIWYMTAGVVRLLALDDHSVIAAVGAERFRVELRFPPTSGGRRTRD